MKKTRRVKKYTGRHHLDLIPLLVLLLILVLLVIFVVKMKERTSLDSNAASYWSRCRCIDNVWVGERCPDVMKGKSCGSDRTTVAPKPVLTVDPTIPPVRTPTKKFQLLWPFN